MSFGEAFLQVSALMTTMSMPLELTIRKRPSAVKSMPTTAPDTYDGQPRRFHVFANSRHAGVDNTSAGNERLITAPYVEIFAETNSDSKHAGGVKVLLIPSAPPVSARSA